MPDSAYCWIRFLTVTITDLIDLINNNYTDLATNDNLQWNISSSANKFAKAETNSMNIRYSFVKEYSYLYSLFVKIFFNLTTTHLALESW